MNLRIFILGLGLLGTIPFKLLPNDSYSWSRAGNGNWGVAGNWTPSGPPNDSGATATFNQITGYTITVSSTYSVGTLTFGTTSVSGYTLSGIGTLNLYNAINNQNTSSQCFISCSIVLEGVVSVSDAGAHITLFGPVTGTGGITLNSGILSFAESSPGQVTYSGTTTINNTAKYEANAVDVFSPNSAYVLMGSAALVPGGASQVIGSLTGGSSTTVQLNGATITIGNDNTSTEYDGVIGDFSVDTGGGVVKTGSGTLTLGGDNTYAGNTTISGGTLVLNGANTFPDTATVGINSGQLTLGNSSALGDAPLTIANSATLALDDGITVSNGVTVTGNTNIVVASGVGTISGAIGGSGSITQSGSGTLVLDSSNSYTEGTNIDAGQITLGNSGGLGSGALTIGGGATLALNNGITVSNGVTLNGGANIAVTSGTATVSGAVGGSGGLTQNGPGTLVLSGGNSYSGATTLAGGTLQLQGSTSLQDSSSVTIGNGVTLDMSVTTGSTTINTLSGAGGIAIGSKTLTVNQESSGTYAGSISGVGGSFVKTGPGALTLSGNNTYTGTTTIAQGSLSISGSSASGLSISSGAILRGTGTFGSITLESGATLAPGNSVGTITTSSVTFAPGSFFQVEINPAAASSLIVTGAAALAGNVEIVQDAGLYAKQGKYLILDAASISGAFAPTILGGLPGYMFNLNQIGNNLYLFYSIPFISTSGLSGNALTVAKYLNDYADVTSIKLLNSLSEDTLSSAINSVSPSRNAFGTYITEQMAFSLSNLLTTHIDKDKLAREESSKQSFVASLLVDASDKITTNKEENSKFSGWISGFGEFAHQKAQSQNPSFNFNSEAVVTGFDYHAGKKGLAGGALGYAHTHFYDEDNAGHGNINYYFASAYGNASIHHFYLSPAIWGVFNQIDNTRKISFPGFSETAKADIFAWQLNSHLEAGYEFKYSWGGFTPFASADWAISWQRAYTEKGAFPFNATHKANNSSMVRSETGVKFCEKWQMSWGAFFLKEKIAYVFEKPFGVGTVNTSFSGIPTAFTVNAVNRNLNLAALGLDFLAALGKDQSWLVDFSYNGEIGVSYWSNDLTLSLTKHF